jgi:hypothetical protein
MNLHNFFNFVADLNIIQNMKKKKTQATMGRILPQPNCIGAAWPTVQAHLHGGGYTGWVARLRQRGRQSSWWKDGGRSPLYASGRWQRCSTAVDFRMSGFRRVLCTGREKSELPAWAMQRRQQWPLIGTRVDIEDGAMARHCSSTGLVCQWPYTAEAVGSGCFKLRRLLGVLHGKGRRHERQRPE